jgi:hypothetical protein
MVFHLRLQQPKKATATNKCTSIAGRFDGHVDALKQCTQHRLMQKIQGQTRCPWTPPSGIYLLSIAPVAARVAGKTTTLKKYTYFAGRFDGHCNTAVQYHAHHPMEEVQGF